MEVGPAMAPPAAPSPWLFLPFGLAPAAVAGYLTIAVVDELSRSGVPLGSVSVLVPAMFLPAAIMFVWAPLVDLIGRRQRWLLAGVLMLCIAAVGLAMSPRTPSAIATLVSFGVLGGFGYSLVSVAQKGLVVELFAPSRRVSAAGWVGAGSGLGLALGGGVLAAAPHLTPTGVAWCLSALVGLPAAASLAVLEPHLATRPRVVPTPGALAKDTRQLFRSPSGRLALAICLLPFASSAAALMVGALGVDFGATPDFVAGWAGTGKSLAFAAGALLGARLWRRIGSRAGYLLTGFGLAVFALLVLAGPKTPSGYAAMVCGFGFLQGASLSAILGIVLETVEPRAASTQAAVLVAAGNLPNVYLPPAAGWAHDTGGLSMLLVVDAAIGLGGLVVYLLCARALHQHAWRGGSRGN